MANGNRQTDSQHFGFTILGSGSKGNATVIHCPGGKILLDAGFSAKELCARMNKCGIAPESIGALLITHEHNDHVLGCRVFSERFGIPVYMTPDTAYAMERRKKTGSNVILINPGYRFDLYGVSVEPFTIPHDVDAVAYTFRTDTAKLGFATDLGSINLLTVSKLKDCTILVLESNYDLESLQCSGRPLQIQQRIKSRHGHLSNEDAMGILPELLSKRTTRLIFAHLSSECNSPELVERLAGETLNSLRRHDVSVSIASQKEPLETYWM